MARNTLPRLIPAGVLALAVAACNQPPVSNDRPSIRLSPVSTTASAIDPAPLVDRDTTAAVQVQAPTMVTLRFGHDVEVRRVKIHGATAVRVGVAGLVLGAPDEAGWSSGTLDAPITTSDLTLSLEPTGAGAQLDELEIWGAGRDLAPRDPAAFASATAKADVPVFENAWTLRATPANATLQPIGSAEGEPCVRARFPAADPRQARRAYLAYEANVVRGDVLQHSFDGDAPAAGAWFGSASGARTVVSEVDPERLRGSDEVLLCLPEDAGGPVTIDGLRLLLVLDDGTNPFDRDAWLRSRNAVDGDASTAAAVSAEGEELAFDRAIDVEAAQLHLGQVPARLARLGMRDGATWREQADLDVTASPSALPVTGRADALRLEFPSSARPDVPVASLGEVVVTGSGLGPRIGSARIVLASPVVTVTGGREVGERFGDRALISGWAESPAGRGAVELEGARVDVDGAFTQVLKRPSEATESWPVTLHARFPDGTEVTRTVYLDDDHLDDLLRDDDASATTSSADQRFGRENQTGWGALDPALGGKANLGTDVSIEAPPGAVSARTSIGITRKGAEVMPHLDPGMINVTAPAHAAYRFTPKGQKFAKPVKVKLPYDPDLLPEGVAPEEVQTYFFDESKGRWFTLPRREVLRGTRQVVSETTHFTFMINAVLVLPDHPGPTSFNPNSIKDLKSADPSAGIDLIEPPDGNNQGSARLSFPIRLPKARGAHQPSLALTYDSTAGNGWLGVGWDVPVSRVSIDTRFGVPEYGGEERYLLDGEAIVPVDVGTMGVSSTPLSCLDTSVPAREYRARVRRDFRRILRCGRDPASYWFEVTDKGGTVHVYGHGENARLTSYIPRVTVPPVNPPKYDIAEWFLERVIDPNRNLTEYAYQHDSPDSVDPVHREPFRQIYLRSIQYTGTAASRTGSGALVGGTAGVYLVELHHDTEARTDEIISARSGFKTNTRRLLNEIEVRLLAGSPSGLVRRYVLSYVPGDQGKSLLAKVTVQGTDGKEFYSHSFGYEPPKAPDQDGVTLFGGPVPWVTETGEDLALTGSRSWSFGFHGFAGIGVSPSKGSGTVGIGFGYGRHQSHTLVSMMDVNGDGLPDRVYGSDDKRQVLFNQGAGQALSSTPPAWDPGANASTNGTGLDERNLGKEIGNSFDASVQAFYGAGRAGGSLNIGASYTLSSSNDFVIDANGDGLPDLVNGGKVYLNQQRSASCLPGMADCCPAGGFCFDPRTTVRALENLGDSEELLTGDSTVAQANAAMEEALTPEDALLEWTAPYDGTVDVIGQLAFLHPESGDRRDGVRLRVYRYDPPIAESVESLGTYLKTPGDATATPVELAHVPVSAGTILYFVLSTLTDFPMNDEAGHTSPVELVAFSPVITYTNAPAKLRALSGPGGAPLYQFDAAADFVLAGDPAGAVNVPRDGRIAFELGWTKRSTSDDVRVCVQYQDPPADDGTPPPSPGPCAAEDSDGFADHEKYKEFTKRFAWSDAAKDARIDVPQLDVKAGGTLYFRIDTDVSIDPRAVQLSVAGGYACVGDDDGTCGPPDEGEQDKLSFHAVPYLALHDDSVDPSASRWTPSGVPVVPYKVKKGGTVRIRSSGRFANRTVPIYFTVRTADQLLFKQIGDHTTIDPSTRREGYVTVGTVQPGDLVFFEAHSESAKSFAAVWDWGWSMPIWSVSCAITTADGTAEDCSTAGWLTTDRHLDSFKDGNQPLLAGGYHGWRFGAWGGKNEAPFEPWVYRGPSEAEADDWDGDDADAVVDSQTENMQKEDDPQRIRLSLAGLLIPSATGTNLQAGASGGEPFQAAGDAFVSQDGNTYFSVETSDAGPTALRMHAGVKGQSASFQEKDPDGEEVKAIRFAIGKLGRSSSAVTVSGNASMSIGFFSAGVALSEGLSSQKMDYLDMNGDGILDVVVGAGMPSIKDGAFWSTRKLADRSADSDVRVTSPVTLATQRAVRMDGYPMITHDVGGQVNVGVSATIKELDSKTETHAVVSRFPGRSGGGVGFSVGSALEELADVNGDGLPDQIRVGAGRCPSGIAVHLNMGTSFASGADCLDLGTDAFPVDSILDALGVEGGPALRRSATVTAQGTAGADLIRTIAKLGGGISRAESWGVGIGAETSLTATNVALVDVTGDGLPDHVYKSNRGDQFVVRVNTGYGFGRPRVWHAGASWCTSGACATPPRLHLGLPSAATKVLNAFLGSESVGGIEPLEATGSHSESPSISFSVDFAFPLFVGTPWLHVGGGASVSPQKVSGFELGLQDIDGDGLPDQVLKTADNAPVWARLNQLGKSNLLTHVERPLHGSIDLAYDRREGNTVEMPQSRWVLTNVTARDGRAAEGGAGHDLATSYAYEHGRYDRQEREFLGFETVTRTNPDDTSVKQVFDNASVVSKGLLRSERAYTKDRVWVETTNAWTVERKTVAADGCEKSAPIFLDAPSYCTSWVPQLDAVTKRFHEGQPSAGIVTRQTFGYDALGNVTSFQDLGDVADPADDVLATIHYASDDAADALYSVARPDSVVATDRNGVPLRSRLAEYDPKTGNLTSFTAQLGNGRTATTELHWYDNGTLEWVKGPPNERNQQYQTNYAYDGVTGAYVTGITDSHGYASSAEYDLRFGEPTSTTDLNGRVTSRAFDAFGRMVRLAGPKDSLAAPTVRIIYAPEASPPYAWTRNRLPRSAIDKRGSVDTVVVMDGLGRTIQTKKTAEIATSATAKGVGWSVSGHQVFDEMGRVTLLGQTFASFSARPEYVPGTPRNPTRMIYDELGRAIQTVEPNGAITRVDYGFGVPAGSVTRRFRTVTTDAEGQAKAAYKDAADRLVAVEERIDGRTPTTSYEYSPVGDLRKVVDAAGNVTSAEYDLLGRRTKLVNPDTGELRFELDAAGNVIRKYDPELDAAQQAIHYVYDFDQMVRIEYPDSARNVTYTYGGAADAPRNGVGRVVAVQDEAGVETRSYDELGSLASSTRVLKAMPPYYRAQTFTTSFTWDSFGRVLSITYPDLETVSYQYDAGGLLESAVGTRPAGSSVPGTETYLASLQYDEFGQRVRMVLGNGTVSTYGYDPLIRRLRTLATVTPLRRTLQAITYRYDRVGNVRTMVNALGSPTEDRSGAVRYDFKYDDLYRLTYAHGEAESRPHTIDRYTATYAFSDVHNMMSNVQVHEILHGDATVSNERPPKTNHEFDYAYDPAHPHRATRIGDTFVHYDRNGNTTVECGGDPACGADANHVRRFAWTEENRLDYVVEGGGRNMTRFVYDAAGDRVVKLGRGGESITVGQFWSLKGRRAATKHVFAGATRLASKLLPPPGWTGAPTATPSTSATTLEVTTTEDEIPPPPGCVPSDYQPTKCPVLPGGEPVINHRFDDTTVRPETYYYHPDHLGSTSWVTDQNGKVHEHVEYFPYGEVWRDPRSDSDGAPVKGQRFLFTSKEIDEETGLYYFGARYYDPRLSRWSTADRLFEGYPERGQGREFEFNLYGYAGGNPVVLVDLDGFETVGELIQRKGVAAAGRGSYLAAAGWAFAQAYWDYLGAEGVSRVTDSALGQRDLTVADVSMAGVEIVTALPPAKAARAGVEGGIILLHAGEEVSGKAAARAAAVEMRAAERRAPGTPPPSLSPQGAGRHGAFREAKRKNKIPTSQQPDATNPNTNLRGQPQPGRQYEFTKPDGSGVTIRDDAGGHTYRPGDPQNRGPHFNDQSDNHYDY